ncbi:MAG TPA: NYN domain-containing protein [Burkholderiaceae bacterium]|nr:NYN domain-containing protein [Burkholderiaceae bacterium]
MAAPVEMGRRLGVLIDADNVSATVVTALLAEIANFGTATARRIYGDWTPRPFIAACDRFIFTDVLTGPASSEATKRVPLKNLRGDTALVTLLRKVVDDSADETGWANLGEVGSRTIKQEPDFDPCNDGFPRLRSLVEEIELFQLEERPGPQGHKHLWLRDKRKKASK